VAVLKWTEWNGLTEGGIEVLEGIASWSGKCVIGCWLSGGSEGECSRTLLVQQRERLLAPVACSSVPSVLNLNRQRNSRHRW
jgi:hypothetical protein